MKRRDEELARASFDRWLRGSLGFSNPEWQVVSGSDEPPDYYLTLDTQHYAVEVTAISEQDDVDGRSMPPASVTAGQDDFLRAVERTAKQKDLLHGVFVVEFSGPLGDWNRTKKRLRRAILDYLQHPQVAGREYAVNLCHDGTHTCSIFKTSDKGACLDLWLWRKSLPQVNKELPGVLRNTLRKKTSKLHHLRVPIILLLLDLHIWPRGDLLRELVLQTSERESFHSIFIVREGRSGFLAWSRDPSWDGVGEAGRARTSV